MTDQEQAAWKAYLKTMPDAKMDPYHVLDMGNAFIAGRRSVTVNAELLAACEKARGATDATQSERIQGGC